MEDKITEIEKEISLIKTEIIDIKKQVEKRKDNNIRINEKLDDLNDKLQNMAVELAKSSQAIDMHEIINQVMESQNKTNEEIIRDLLSSQKKQLWIFMGVFSAAFLGILCIVAPSIPNFIK